jgi:hypothetical protein
VIPTDAQPIPAALLPHYWPKEATTVTGTVTATLATTPTASSVCPDKVTQVTYAQLGSFKGCDALLEGPDGTGHGIWVAKAETLPQREGSYWVLPSGTDLAAIANEFRDTKCVSKPGLVVTIRLSGRDPVVSTCKK